MTVQYSIQHMVSNGTLSTITLGIQYLQRNDIYIRIAGEETPQSGAPSGYTWSFIDNTTLKILPVVPNGVEVVVYRRTDVDAMYNIYSQNAQFDEATIDENNQQLLYIAQEYLEQGLPGAGVDTLEYVRDDGSFTYYRLRRTDGSYSEEFHVPSASNSTKVLTRESLRRSYAEAGYNLVAGSFEAGGILVNANDVLLQEATGKAFSGPAGTVAAGTAPTSGGFVDKSSAIGIPVTYAGIRSYSGESAELRCVGRQTAFDRGFGYFARDDSDTTSPDDDGTVLIDALSRRWKRMFVGAADVGWWGAVGDGVADDTLAVQACFDAATGDIDLGGRTYLVRKNAALASTYPSEQDFSDGSYNFSPCTALVGKQGLTVRNGHLKTNVHGMDVLALVNCQNVSISGVRVSGPGIFPAIDTPTGYAEKGTVGFGYDSAQITAPNNALDTSAYTSGAYNGVNGQFPVYNTDGSQAAGWQAQWGTFLNGYIGSWASGIKVQRACKGILIFDCKVTGFNFAGIGIGIRNAAVAYGTADYTNDTDVPTGVLVLKCDISECYSGGIYVLSGYKLNYESNVISNIGHPNGNDTLNASLDPGYGITHGRNRRIRNVIVSKNQISNCRRKSIDFHGGGQLIITDNFCLETGLVGIYAKTGQGYAPDYEPYNLIISGNYIRTRDMPDSTPSGPLVGEKYTRCIDISGGSEAAGATYPHPFAKISNNYCELRAFDGVAISSSAADTNWHVFNDIDVSHNTVVLKCLTLDNKAEGIALNAGATAARVFREQTIKLIGNSVKQFNRLNLDYRVVGYRVKGVPKSVIANGNTVDLNVINQTGMLAAFNMDSRTYFSFSGNQALSIGPRASLTSGDIFFYDNARLTIAAGSGEQTIPVSLYRGVWQMTVAGSGNAFGSKQVQFASTGSGGTGADVVRSTTTGFIANIGISATAIYIPSVTEQTDVVINLKPIVQYDGVL